ncbi:MAG: ABC transporter ATP-binding protein [Methanospirillum sp.]|nr:ABC transporter ATP-binding protein [Methanospirillum sp.]
MTNTPTTAGTASALGDAWAVMTRAVRLVFSLVPGLTVLNSVLVVVQGLLPLAALYVMKLIIDAVTAGVPGPGADVSGLVLLIAVAAGIGLLTAAVRALATYSAEAQSLALSDHVADEIHEQSTRLDLAFFENPAYHDTLHRAQSEGPGHLGLVVNHILAVAQSAVSVVAVGGFVVSVSPVVGLVIIGAALPAAAVQVWYSRRRYDLRFRQAAAERKTWYYHYMMTSAHHAGEVRLLGLGPLFRERYRDLRRSLRDAVLALSKSRSAWEVLTQGLVTLAVFGSFGIVALRAVRGELSVGDLVAFLAGFQLCIGYVQSIFSSLNALYEDQLFLANLFAFLDLEPFAGLPGAPGTEPPGFSREVRFEDVSFAYPGSSGPALRHVSLALRQGEVVALVGENGAGKSTFVRLLCRLYDPTVGRITIDGRDLHEIDPGQWQRGTTVLSQDFVRYHMTARENIWLGNIARPAGSPHVEEAAREAAADAVIGRLPDGYETQLGKMFDSGHDLSTGEWQKIALARAFFRDAGIVVLDEPASSLDAIAEAEIFDRFRDLVRGRTAVLVSHRFSTVILADRIFVFARGEVVEQGSHAELMEKGGLYARMFLAQAGPYR